ncbi:MAG: DNA-binding transcriptional regulator, partial [Clostridia bacterium]|nr:DNA-binding transcriptional regulator [Clostridia bacterium]
MDTSILGTLSLIAPDLMGELELRALILERGAALGPIGRRALAGRLNLSERTVRAAADALREAGCITQSAAGMEICEEGRMLVETARAVSRARRSIQSTELTLSRKLNIERVCVVRGDADKDPDVIEEIAHAAAGQLRFLLQGAQVLAVSGGRTVAAMAEVIGAAAPMDITVVPSHGGLGGASQTQANTVTERVAHALGGRHRLLHLPDGLSRSAAAELSRLPQVREPLELLKHADVLLYGVGRAQDLAVRRGLNSQERDDLTAHGAVAEALGYYFDAQGRVVGGASLT